MTQEQTNKPSAKLDDFTEFVASAHAVSRDAAQAVLGEWLLHYLPTESARRMAKAQRVPEDQERATVTPEP